MKHPFSLIACGSPHKHWSTTHGEVESIGSDQEVCFGPSRPDPGRNAWDEDGTRMGRDGPTSGPGRGRNAVKQNTWRIWTGPLRTRDGTWTGIGSDTGEGLDGTPRDSSRPLGLPELNHNDCVFSPRTNFMNVPSPGGKEALARNALSPPGRACPKGCRR